MRAHQLHLQSLRRRACKDQGGRCYYCLRPMGRDVTAEHLVARMDGGKDSPTNVVAACRLCNQSRHALFPGAVPDPETYQGFVLLVNAAGMSLDDCQQKAASVGGLDER